MEYINISHKRDYEYKVHAVSSEQHESFSVFNIQKEKGHWSSRKNDENISEYIILDFQKNVTVDYIEMLPSTNGYKSFPHDFRFEGSLDGNYWMVIHTEKKFELDSAAYRLDIPLTLFRFLKILIITSPQIDGKYFSEIGYVRTGIAGIREMTASSVSNKNHDAEKLLLDAADTCWESELKSHISKESITINLGKIFHVNRIILGSTQKGFPENFFIETSSDNNVWLPLLEEKNFKAQENKRYFWNTDITPAQYVRIEAKSVKFLEGKFGIQMARLEISAAPFNPFHTHNIGDLTPYASIFQAGIVRLAKDSEDSPGTAVQGNDRRLRDATTIFKGITQLAEDGDTSAGLSVQASDSRLKPATDLKPGIVRLAHNRENKPGVVVQGNDSRLQESTANNFGIVKLCPDGMYKDNVAVTGNDQRLHKATGESYGICKLALDGSESSGTVVQANDKRLRTATTVYKGIVELAEDGEDCPGVAIQGNDKRLKNATTTTHGIVEMAEDCEDKAGVVVQGNDKRLKDATEDSKGIVELAKNGEDKAGVVVQGNDKRLKDATEDSKGIVELAKDGEDKAGVVVQGNDWRLKNASITAKGIVELADDGEDKAGVVVQGNDRRLKNATTLAKGIVELAENGEDGSGIVVQGNDRRLKNATINTKGIVELAEDGEDKADVVVQGNDRRLKNATINTKGIVELAEDGEDKADVVVQGNDKRLKDATTTAKGIVELAEDGEDRASVAVQGNDRRLKNATTFAKGIVELAEDGEDSPGVVVQGNDTRIKMATDISPGIVMLAKNNESRHGTVVQSTDVRLDNARDPLPHDHEYARLKHEFSSHTGTISIRDAKQETFAEITPPSDNSAIIYAQNQSTDSGSIGITGIAGITSKNGIHTYGLVGHSSHIGVRGQSSGNSTNGIKGCGILGISRLGAGGVFASEHDYSLIADGYGAVTGYDDSINLMGNGDALYVKGTSLFKGKILIQNASPDEKQSFPSNIVEIFEVDEAEYISPGDVLVASDAGKQILSRSRVEYNRAVIGIVSGNPTVVINNSGKEKKVYPIALSGTVLCKIDARQNPVNPGDLIVTASTPGCGMVGNIDSFNKIGTVIGKALDALEDGIDVIPIFITHM